MEITDLEDIFKFTKHVDVQGHQAGAVWWVGNTFPMPDFQQGSGGVHTSGKISH
jgi:hypothetical protein